MRHLISNSYKILFVCCFLLYSCNNTKQSESISNINVIDVTQIHSEQALNIDEEIVSFEFVPLETNDEFLCAGELVTFTDEVIIYKNNYHSGQDIIIFDRKGKPLRKINHQGEGSEEYSGNWNLVYDDANKELFISDISGNIQVYDMEGNFKRNLPTDGNLHEFENYDNESLIYYIKEDVDSPLFLISKQTGDKIREIVIPYKKRFTESSRWKEGEESKTVTSDRKILVKSGDEILISEISSDTIYSLNPKKSTLQPILSRIPAIETMNVPVFLFTNGKAGDFLFLSRKTKKEDSEQAPIDSWVYDCRDGAFYDIFHSPKLLWGGNAVNAMHDSKDNVFLIEYSAQFLKEAEANLTGEIKEIASRLKENDNPVVAIITLKK